jgi:hypothetical protein
MLVFLIVSFQSLLPSQSEVEVTPIQGLGGPALLLGG